MDIGGAGPSPRLRQLRHDLGGDEFEAVHVIHVEPLQIDALYTMASSSNHPVSRAIAEHLKARDPKFLEQLPVDDLPGLGLVSVQNGHELRLGSSSFTLGRPSRDTSPGSAATSIGVVDAPSCTTVSCGSATSPVARRGCAEGASRMRDPVGVDASGLRQKSDG